MQPDHLWEWVGHALAHVGAQRLQGVAFGEDVVSERRSGVTAIGLVLLNFKNDFRRHRHTLRSLVFLRKPGFFLGQLCARSTLSATGRGENKTVKPL